MTTPPTLPEIAPLHVRRGIVPRGLTREDAAEYCGVTAWTFDDWRRRNLIPDPMPGTKRWDRKALDLALDQLSNIAPASPKRGAFGDVGKNALRG